MLKESPVITLNNFISKELYEVRDDIMGKILTIIDASISDQEQRKGLKDIIRQSYDYNELKWVRYRIGRMLREFNEKFAKLSLNPEEDKFLETGEYPSTEATQSLASPSYFPEE